MAKKQKSFADKASGNKNIDSVFGSRFLKNSKDINYPKVKFIFQRVLVKRKCRHKHSCLTCLKKEQKPLEFI